MKKSIFLLPLLIFACAPKQTEKTAIVNGKITDPTKDIVVITLNDKNDTAKIKEDGTFYMKIKIEKPQYGTIRSGEYSNIFLSPGDSIYVEVDTKEFDESITYSGLGAEINNYLAAKLLLVTNATSPATEFYKVDEKVFGNQTDSLTNAVTGLLNKLTVKNKVFQELEPKNIEYLRASLFLKYPKYHEYYAKDTTYEMSESFWSFLETIEIENSKYWQLNSYRDFFNTYYTNQVSELMNDNETLKNVPEELSFTKAQLEFIKTKMTDPILKGKKAGEAMYNQVRYYDTENIEGLMEDFLALCKDSFVINNVNEIIEKKKKIAKGMPAPDFATVDAEENEVSLSDFKGKYVYIDFWASWCGPCRQEIPHFKKLTADYKGKNIEFLSVSVDAQKNAWEKAIETHDLSGNLLYVGSKNKVVRDEYMVYSIPRFILVDTEGKFITSNAPRPSSDEIRKLLNELI